MPQPDMRRRDCLALLAGTVLCSTEAGADASAPVFDDCMPAFWAAYDTSRHEALTVRGARLMSEFFDPASALYRRAGSRITVDQVSRWLLSFDTVADDVRAVQRQFADTYAAQLARFRRALPDFDGSASPVYLLPSLYAFDAHLEADGASLPLFFSPDGIVRLHGRDADLGVLFAHELFHCYQAQKSPSLSLDPQPPLFASLWIEGVATYASECLNPQASLVHVLLDDFALAQTTGETLRAAAASMLPRLEARDAASQAEFFQLGKTGHFPPRMGYYLGLLVARATGTAQSLPQMAAVPASDVRERVSMELRRLAAA